jgi:hypothetical protein
MQTVNCHRDLGVSVHSMQRRVGFRYGQQVSSEDQWDEAITHAGRVRSIALIFIEQ